MKCKIYGLLILALGLLSGSSLLYGQSRVLLDNYFNQETTTSGKPFHYLWTDEANSGFSQWGALFRQKGAQLSTLRQAPTKALLKGADVYIIVDPDTRLETKTPNYISADDIKNIVHWVRRGGILVLMANDSVNAEFPHLNQLAARFGLHFNPVISSHVVGKNWDMGAVAGLPGTPFEGLKKMYMKDVSTLQLSGGAQPLIQKKDDVFMAVTAQGKGHVVAVTDPWIYNEYIDHKYLPADFENKQAAERFTAFLLELAGR